MSLPVRCQYSLDATSVFIDTMANVARLEEIVRSIAQTIDMHVLSINSSHIKDDLIKAGRGCFPPEGGYSVQALITTSHLALHTWPEQSFFMFDVVSCKWFDAATLKGLVYDLLGVSSVQHEQVIDGYHTRNANPVAPVFRSTV